MIVPMPSSQQRVALVTGSSRGLGSAIARRLAEDGLAVAVNGVGDDAQARAVVDAIKVAGGVAAAFTGDVTNDRQSVELVAGVTERLGPVDVLVVNATGPQPEAPLIEVSWEDHLAQLEFFVKSPVLLGRAVVPGMRARAQESVEVSFALPWQEPAMTEQHVRLVTGPTP
jgi:3-oxoacyl-[acyl-carrier protein] reductase